MNKTQQIRNFSIIAHIDHGKSTLADRFIQFCGGLSDREMSTQILDSMELERERGITIKSQSVSLNYHADNGQNYQLNLIDTPGHVDFSYEVSRSLAACEGALLVVDAAQGVEAQSVANCFTALEHNLEIITVINKIDLSAADPKRVAKEIEIIIGLDTTRAVQVSAKSGLGVKELLEQIVADIPPPKISTENTCCRALIIDSWFDNYLGLVTLVRVVDGQITCGEKIRIMSTQAQAIIDELGVFTPKKTPRERLVTGEVGYVIAGIKDINAAPVGDTLTTLNALAKKSLPGFKKAQPKIFAGLFPVNSNDYEACRDALAKLCLNDAALYYEPETSEALGFGFRCGFLGMLHMEIIQERLEREYDLELLITAPTVVYQMLTKKQQTVTIDNPNQLNMMDVDSILEPIIQADILVPQEYLGNVITLCIEKRGVQKALSYLGNQVSLVFELPMSEVVLDFFDRLKSVSRGYASFDYSFLRFQAANLVKVDILINGKRVDALSCIVHYDKALQWGRQLTQRITEFIPRQMFAVPIQAAIGGKILARETVKALRKNVTAKCYGGDVTRKRKLLEKQKAGKKRMKQFASVDIPQEAFMAILHVGKNK